MSTDTITAARRPIPGVRLTLLLGSLTAFGPMAIDMYLPAMPAIAAELHTDPASAQQTMSVFLVGMALGGWISGFIFDRTGSYLTAFANGFGWNLMNIAIIAALIWSARRGGRAVVA